MPNPTRTTYEPDQLNAGHFPILTESGVIAAGQVLKRGAVLGQVSADSQYKLSEAAAEDGSEVPMVILEEDVDTTEGARTAPVRLTGEVLGSVLSLGAGHTLAAVKAALRPFSLFVR